MNILDVTDLSKSYGTNEIIRDGAFALDEVDRVGIIGLNGCGKSTLLRILAGLESADTGEIAKKRNLTIGYLPQKPELDPESTIRQTLEIHLGEPRRMLLRHGELTSEITTASGCKLEKLLEEQVRVHDWLDHHSAWNLDHRVDQMCTRFNVEDSDAKIGSLSGGWSQRIGLAGMLLGQPGLLLLDEPTNQIDAETIGWLEEHLADYPGALLMITHDRYFLDRVVNRIFELENGTLTGYVGGYSSYLEKKAERLEAADHRQTRLLNLLRREEEWLSRSPKARTTKQKARIDRAGELKKMTTVSHSREMKMDMTTDQRLGHTILTAEKLAVSIGGKTLVEGLDFILRKRERVGILGPNGCGKTTLIRTLLGQVDPASGKVTLGKNTRIGYLDQMRTGLDEEETVGSSISDNDWVIVKGGRGSKRDKRHKIGYLENFLFTREDQKRKVSTLSGGERARLLLAKLMLEGCNVLVLDEPTNDLDIPTMQLLDEAMTDFAGCILMVTHDRYFLDRVATGILHFETDSRKVVYYEGNYRIFKQLKNHEPVEGKDRPKKDPQPKNKSRTQRPQKGLTFKERRELTEVERRIGELELRLAEVEELLADPSKLPATDLSLTTLSSEHFGIKLELEELLCRWEVLESKKG